MTGNIVVLKYGREREIYQMKGFLFNLIIAFIPTLCSILVYLYKRFFMKKEWIIYSKGRIWQKIFLYGKPIIDIFIAQVSVIFFSFIFGVISILLKNKYIFFIIITLNIITILFIEIIINYKLNSVMYIYKKIKRNKIRKIINIIYHIPAIAFTIMFWAVFMENTLICDICAIMYVITSFSFILYTEPVTKKSNKFVDIFTDTRKSYLNIKCEEISQKGEWYIIKEENAIRKIRKNSISELVCHD